MNIPSTTELVIIGGGINGAAIARDATLRGIKVVLLEKNDFASGASSKTSKLAHGGLRYLENFQFSLVRESIIERSLLLKNAPHLVHPLPFILPVYKKDPHSRLMIHLGLYLYDHLGGDNPLPRHHQLSIEEMQSEFPFLNEDQLVGGCHYLDAQMQDNRLVIENILAAESAGAQVFNYVPVTKILTSNGKTSGVVYCDPVSKTLKEISCNIVVNATGAWSSETLHLDQECYQSENESGTGINEKKQKKSVAPSKGVHIVIPEISSTTALLLHAPQDKRVFFVLPWEGYSLVGTTDTFYHGNPDEIKVEDCDRDYLLNALKSFFPALKLDHTAIISEFVGLRPLVSNDANNSTHASASELKRSHAIAVSKSGLITISGGKHTTHRKIAQDVVDVAVQELARKTAKQYNPCTTMNTPLPGAIEIEQLQTIEKELLKFELSLSQVSHLINTYGMLAKQILAIIKSDQSQLQTIYPDQPYLQAEWSYVQSFEHAKTIEDWLYRRTSLAYTSPDCRVKSNIFRLK